MKDSKRATVYFDPEVHRALSRKAAKSDQSISHVVNEAVRIALAEDSADLKAFRDRASEKNLDFVDVVKSLRRRGKLKLQIKESAAKELESLGTKKDRERIVARINALATDPRPSGSEKLEGEGNKYRVAARQLSHRIFDRRSQQNCGHHEDW